LFLVFGALLLGSKGAQKSTMARLVNRLMLVDAAPAVLGAQKCHSGTAFGFIDPGKSHSGSTLHSQLVVENNTQSNMKLCEAALSCTSICLGPWTINPSGGKL